MMNYWTRIFRHVLSHTTTHTDTRTQTDMSLWGPAEVSHRCGAEDQGRGQAGRWEEIIISIHFSPSFPWRYVTLMFPAFISQDPISCVAVFLQRAISLKWNSPSFKENSLLNLSHVRLLSLQARNSSCDRLQGLSAHRLVQTPLMVHYTLMTPTVTLVTAGCAEEFREGANWVC